MKLVHEQLLEVEKEYRENKEKKSLERELYNVLYKIPKEHKAHYKILEAIFLLRNE